MTRFRSSRLCSISPVREYRAFCDSARCSCGPPDPGQLRPGAAAALPTLASCGPKNGGNQPILAISLCIQTALRIRNGFGVPSQNAQKVAEIRRFFIVYAEGHTPVSFCMQKHAVVGRRSKKRHWKRRKNRTILGLRNKPMG